ncbi:MAG TPA: NUDIX hydrolase [Alphaproteobacteria bacterium]|nr:NUDIX hydrolase [Alphaproteobacteria bacterium]
MAEKQILKAAAHAFIIKDNQILLSVRIKTGYCDGLFGVPAGHVDDKEVSTQALIRELQEEVNLSVYKKSLKHVVSMHRTVDEVPYFCTFFELKDLDLSTLNNNEPEKCRELKWFDLNNLPENMVPYVKNAIEAYKSKTNYLEDF